MKKFILSSLAVALLLCFLVFGYIPDTNAESVNNPKGITNKSLDLWNNGNISLLGEIYSPDYTLHLINQDNPEIVGTEALKDYVNFLRTAYPDLKFVREEVMVSGNKVISQTSFSGTNTGPRGDLQPTGKSVNVSGVIISRIDDGKIAEEWIYINMASVYKQLGFTITPPSGKQ
ncbi:MAG: ester cyclase [Thermodesulfobacteriota bacterium]